MADQQPATRDDITRLYDDLNRHKDKTAEAFEGLRITLTKLEAAIDNMPRPKQPCQWLEQHLAEYQEEKQQRKTDKNMWKSALIANVVKLIFTGITIAVSVVSAVKWAS